MQDGIEYLSALLHAGQVKRGQTRRQGTDDFDVIARNEGLEMLQEERRLHVVTARTGAVPKLAQAPSRSNGPVSTCRHDNGVARKRKRAVKR